ncbi:MAG: hypothetical protein K8R54_04130 [Bacteroidales bacterium]|nr:hypothetical protein [Bacteroidales bacterium]
MRKLLLITGILSCVLFNSYAVEKTHVYIEESNSSVLSDQQNQNSDIKNIDLSVFEKAKKEKTSKNKTFFGKTKEKISTLKHKTKKFFRSKGFYIGAFLLGFFLGLIGILIVFLVNLNHPERKAKMRFAWLGWVWWLVILSIILVV